jgi:CHASE2 domain-containing sensor protein
MGVLRATLRKRPVAGLVIAIVVTLGVVEARSLGLLLRPELTLHDALLRLQTNATAAPERVTVIRIREEDIARHGHPLPDATLADVLERILAAQPRAVGIDLYRDLPVGEGQERLSRLFLERTRVVGIEKFPDQDRPGTPPPAWLQGSQQVGFSDIPLDDDGVVRRALLFLWDDQDRMHVSLALRLALLYLGDEGVALASNDPHGEVLQVGRAEIRPFRAGDGAYATADDRGYQVLLDHRRGIRPFDSRSIEELLGDAVPAAELHDRVVIVGTAAPSVKDVFLTPFTRTGRAPRGAAREGGPARALLETRVEGRSR